MNKQRRKLTTCPMCGKKAIEYKITDLKLARGVISSVPHERCGNCGEVFLSAESYEVIEQYESEHAA